MNIFILDQDPVTCATYHCDKHVIKMILESAQLLSTAVNVLSGKQVAPYKSTHINHPCSIWARQSYANFAWLWELMCALNYEYKYRFPKPLEPNHLAYDKCFIKLLDYGHLLPNQLHRQPMDPFVQCMPEQYKQKDAVKAYRAYYKGDKQHLAKWTKRIEPYWF